MNRYVKRTIIILIIVLIAGGLGYYSYSRNKFDFNEDNATGNTPGNINNGGLFVNPAAGYILPTLMIKTDYML